MSLTWTQMCTEVTKNIGDRVDVADRVSTWLKWAQFRIGLRWYHNELEVRHAGVLPLLSTSYTLPSQCLGIIAFRDEIAKRKLTPKDMQYIASLDLTVSGIPSIYARFGSVIYFDKKVSAANDFTLWYYKRPLGTAMSLDEMWEEPLVALGTAIAYRSLFDPVHEAQWLAVFRDAVTTLPEVKVLDSRNWDFPIEVHVPLGG